MAVSDSSHSDALIMFGVTGDLAHKKIFPALYSLVKQGKLKGPVIGVAFPKWSLARLHRWVTHRASNAPGVPRQPASALHQLLSPRYKYERGLQRSLSRSLEN